MLDGVFIRWGTNDCSQIWIDLGLGIVNYILIFIDSYAPSSAVFINNANSCISNSFGKVHRFLVEDFSREFDQRCCIIMSKSPDGGSIVSWPFEDLCELVTFYMDQAILDICFNTIDFLFFWNLLVGTEFARGDNHSALRVVLTWFKKALSLSSSRKDFCIVQRFGNSVWKCNIWSCWHRNF